VIYRGDALPGCRGNAFIPEPGGNLVKRMILREKGGVITAANALAGRDFLTSTDERFRPVQAVNAPDGALYIADMSRGILQHGSFLTHYLIANIKARQLEQPVNQGRIWRVVHESQPAPKPARIPADTASRVKMLDHPNGWARDAAQRLLVEKGGTEAVAPLVDILKNPEPAPLTRLHALWTLHGLGALTPELQLIAIKDGDAQVRAAGYRNATREIIASLIAPSAETHPLVQAHLAVKLSSLGMPDTDAALARLLVVAGKNNLAREGALTGLRGREAAFAKTFAATEKSSLAPEVLEALASLVSMAGKAQPIGEILALAATQKPGSAAQSALIKGLATQSGEKKDKSVSPAKLVWMDGPVEALTKLAAANPKGASASLVKRISERIVWPGKPGAPEPPKIVPLTPAQTALFEKGRLVFQTLCAACHQPHGFGLDGLAPPLVDSEWVLGRPDVPARIILHGLAGPMKVGSRTWNLAMPPLPQLSDEDVAAVLTYIRREWEHTASAVEPAFVTSLRAQHKGRAAMWTAEELKKK
jgi:mono/diheme cytochrome c family protein